MMMPFVLFVCWSQLVRSLRVMTASSEVVFVCVCVVGRELMMRRLLLPSVVELSSGWLAGCLDDCWLGELAYICQLSTRRPRDERYESLGALTRLRPTDTQILAAAEAHGFGELVVVFASATASNAFSCHSAFGCCISQLGVFAVVQCEF